MRRGAPTSHDLAGMEHALRLARAAAVRDEVPVGCVIFEGSTLLGEAHNETEQRHDPMAHAEVLALQRAMQAGHADRLASATLFVTLSPVRSAPVPSSCRGWGASCSARGTSGPGWWDRCTTSCGTLGSITGRR